MKKKRQNPAGRGMCSYALLPFIMANIAIIPGVPEQSRGQRPSGGRGLAQHLHCPSAAPCTRTHPAAGALAAGAGAGGTGGHRSGAEPGVCACRRRRRDASLFNSSAELEAGESAVGRSSLGLFSSSSFCGGSERACTLYVRGIGVHGARNAEIC